MRLVLLGKRVLFSTGHDVDDDETVNREKANVSFFLLQQQQKHQKHNDDEEEEYLKQRK